MPEQESLAEIDFELGPLTESLGFLSRVVQIQISERIRACGGLGMSPATYSTLRLIEANPGIRQVDAARILLIQESNMASLVKELIAQEFIERRGKGVGKRAGLWITTGGRRHVKKAESAKAIDRAYAEVLSDKEYRQLVGLLDRVYRASIF